MYSTLVSLSAPTNDTSEIISAAKRGLKKIYKEGLLYKKCGVILVDLSLESEIPLDFFRGNPDPKRQKLMKIIDKVNAKQGKDTIFYGAMGVEPYWKMRSDKRSSRFTTSWNELAVVKS
jgi:DNA polymerase V